MLRRTSGITTCDTLLNWWPVTAPSIDASFQSVPLLAVIRVVKTNRTDNPQSTRCAGSEYKGLPRKQRLDEWIHHVSPSMP
jgi:hypothetical protein